MSFYRSDFRGMTDNGQMAIAVATGIVGIRAISVELDQLDDYVPFMYTTAKVILSIGYFALIIFGISTMAHNRLFNTMVMDYSKKSEIQVEGKQPTYEDVIRSHSNNIITGWTLK